MTNETNPLVILLARVATDVVARRLEAAERRAKLTIVEPAKKRGGQAG